MACGKPVSIFFVNVLTFFQYIPTEHCIMTHWRIEKKNIQGYAFNYYYQDLLHVLIFRTSIILKKKQSCFI